VKRCLTSSDAALERLDNDRSAPQQAEGCKSDFSSLEVVLAAVLYCAISAYSSNTLGQRCQPDPPANRPE
jgi:hypothetical protein